MKVTLLTHTPNPEKIVAAAARLCYINKEVSEIMDNFTEDKVEKFINKLIELGHESPLEHVTFTFGIEGISRACSHQLVRHRIASYSHKSQRYVREDYFDYVIPETIKEKQPSFTYGGYIWDYDDIMEILGFYYRAAVEAGVPAEDARFVLPNATKTSIIVTMNVRTLLNFFKHRDCNRAQWEIRELSREMMKLCKEIAPRLFKGAGASCRTGKCSEGSMSCGAPLNEDIG